MTFGEIVYAVTGAFGWVLIALVIVALGFVLAGYFATARRIRRERGWSGLWAAIREHVLTRKPRR